MLMVLFPNSLNKATLVFSASLIVLPRKCWIVFTQAYMKILLNIALKIFKVKKTEACCSV